MAAASVTCLFARNSSRSCCALAARATASPANTCREATSRRRYPASTSARDADVAISGVILLPAVLMMRLCSTALRCTAQRSTAQRWMVQHLQLATWQKITESHTQCSHSLTIDTNTCYTETVPALHMCTLWWWAHATRRGATAPYPQTPPTRASAQTAGRPRILTAHSPQ